MITTCSIKKLEKQLVQLGSEYELLTSDTNWLKSKITYAINNYNPEGWDARLESPVYYDYYIMLDGWAKNVNEKHSQFISIILNGASIYDGLLADYPAESFGGPSGAYGFRLNIDYSQLHKHMNVIYMCDFSSYKVVDFRVFWDRKNIIND